MLELLSLGMDNDQIAARLYISRNTVKFHVRTIYGRLGVHNRVEAARVLAGAGVVSVGLRRARRSGGPCRLPLGLRVVIVSVCCAPGLAATVTSSPRLVSRAS